MKVQSVRSAHMATSHASPGCGSVRLPATRWSWSGGSGKISGRIVEDQPDGMPMTRTQPADSVAMLDLVVALQTPHGPAVDREHLLTLHPPC